MQFTACDQPVQRFYWPENAIDWLMPVTYVMRHARTHKLQLNGPIGIVHTPYCYTTFEVKTEAKLER